MFKVLKDLILTKNTLSSVMWFTVLGFLQPAVGIFLLPLYMGFITPEEYGSMTLIKIFAAVLLVFSNLKMDAAVRTFYFDYNHDEKLLWKYLSQIFSFSVILSLGFFGALFLFGNTLFQIMFATDEVDFMPLGVLAIAYSLLTTCSGVYLMYLKNKVRIKEFAILTVTTLFFTIGLQYYFIAHRDMSLLGVFLGQLIPAALLFMYISLSNFSLFTVRFNKDLILPSLKYALPLIPFSFLFVFEKQLDRIVLERYMELDTVGLYSLLIALVGTVGLFLSAMDNGIRPYLYTLLKENGIDVKHRVFKYFIFYLVVGLIGLSGVLLVGSNLNLLTSNPEYLVIMDYFSLAILCAIPLILVRFLALILVFYKRSVELTIATIVKTIIMVVCMVIFIPRYGIEGALAAVGFSYILNAIIFSVLISRFGDISFDWVAILFRIGIAVAIGVLLYIFFADRSLALYGLIQVFLITGFLMIWDGKRIYSLINEVS